MLPALIGAIGNIGAAAAQGQPSMASASSSASAQSDNVFDSSGWTVATGNASAGRAFNPYLIGAGILAVTLVALVWLKRK